MEPMPDGGGSTPAGEDVARERRRLALEEVAAEVRVCTACRLSTTRTHAVPGEGDPATVVLFVGEGPGRDEDLQGRPFVGRSGQLLTETLRKLGIGRDEVFITNVVKCRPPENRDPEPEEMAACSNYLERQIELINPRIIVTLGRISMARYFPGQKITQVHGQVRNIGHGRVAIAMFHPAAALRDPARRAQFDEDFAQLPRLIERAKRANEAALRGTGRPAGVPHPGDPDYVAEPDGVEQPASEAAAKSLDDSIPAGEQAEPAGADAAPAGAPEETLPLLSPDGDEPEDDPQQLRLF